MKYFKDDIRRSLPQKCFVHPSCISAVNCVSRTWG